MPHFLNCVSNFPLHRRTKACLEPVIKFTSIVEEFDHHWSVLPVNLFLVDSSHVFLTDLSSSERSVDKDRGSLLIMLSKMLLLPLD